MRRSKAGAGSGGRGHHDPSRAAQRLVERHGNALLATARRYAPSAEDAEDAYQRALEIFLLKAPPLPDEELLPWMRTVVKHEAFAIWRGREPTVGDAEEALAGTPSAGPAPDEQVHRLERLSVGAEAMQRLKPQEIRCLLLRAEGYSYNQICEQTGWTYTKVNRCLTEGRRRFLERVSGIESGAECERMTPLLSALADGEARAEDLAALRPHLRACHGCRARLREFRTVPARVAALLPAAAVAAGVATAPRDPVEALGRSVEAVSAWAQERAGILAVKAQALADGASASKVAAVAASTVALAGGTVVIGALNGNGSPEAPAHAAPPERREPQTIPPGAGSPAADRSPREERPEDPVERTVREVPAPPERRPARRAEIEPADGPRRIASRTTQPAPDLSRDDPRARDRRLDTIDRRPGFSERRRADEEPPPEEEASVDGDDPGATDGEPRPEDPLDDTTLTDVP